MHFIDIFENRNELMFCFLAVAGNFKMKQNGKRNTTSQVRLK